MSSPLIRRLLEHHGYPLVDAETLDGFTAAHEHAVLFFTEDPIRYPESDDVAVILPEPVAAFGRRFAAAVVARPAEKVLQHRFGFRRWPALVFLRRGRYLGAIAEVRAWQGYLEEIPRILAAEPTRPPGFRVAVVAEQARDEAH
jgi:hydrogenase-1 operon protein HyaE